MGDLVGALVAVSAGDAVGTSVEIAVKAGGSEVGVKVGNCGDALVGAVITTFIGKVVGAEFSAIVGDCVWLLHAIRSQRFTYGIKAEGIAVWGEA